MLSLIREKQLRHKVCSCADFSFWMLCQAQTQSTCGPSLIPVTVQHDGCVGLKNILSWKIHVSQRRGVFYCSWQTINVGSKSTSETCPILISLTSVWVLHNTRSRGRRAPSFTDPASPYEAALTAHCFQNVFMAIP